MAAALKDSSRGSSEGRERHRARNTLVVAQVALAAVLLVASGLMVRTFIAIRDVPPGFQNPESVLTLRISIPQRRCVADPATGRAHARTDRAQRIEAIGGVESVGVSSSDHDGRQQQQRSDLGRGFSGGRTGDSAAAPPQVHRRRYFATMGNPVIAGRDMTWDDVHNAAAVALVSENLAREYWGEPAKAIGKRHPAHAEDRLDRNRRRRRQRAPGRRDRAGADDRLLADAHRRQTSTAAAFVQRSLAYAIRSSRLQSPGFLGEVQQAVWSVNPNLPLARVRTLQQIYDESMAQTSFVLVILGIAASVTLLLGLVGIYGVIAYIVSQRRREVGIRMALGAQGESVQRIFVSRGLIARRDRAGASAWSAPRR